MTNRQAQLLNLVIEEHIATAEPVSSKLIEESKVFDVSSATIRAEMNELERLGYLEQPHTSAGRVPSDKAYRFYVDNLVQAGRIEPESRLKHKIKNTVERFGDDPRDVNRAIAQLLSELTGNLVIAKIIESDDCAKAGLSGLFESPEFREFDRMVNVTNFFDEFENIFHEMARSMFKDFEEHTGIRVLIGRESPFRDIRDESMIVAEYRLPRRLNGSVTVVGPTRMNYAKNMGVVNYTAEELNKMYKA